MGSLKKVLAAGVGAVALVVPSVVLTPTAQASDHPTGIEVCSARASEPGTVVRWSYKDYVSGRVNGPWLQPGQCSVGYNGSGLLRIEFGSLVSSRKWGRKDHPYGACYSVVPFTYYDPPNSANDSRLTIRMYSEYGC